MISVIIWFIKGLHSSLSRNNVYKVLLITLVIMFIAASSFYYFERPYNEGLTYGDSLWWSFVTVTTVGYGDYFPVTLAVRILAGILMVAGIGAFGFVTAAVASAFIEINLKRGMGLLKVHLKGHVILVGWNKRAKNIVEELLRERPNSDIVVIADLERLDREYKQVHFVRGKGTEDLVLGKAAVEEASLAIVLADEREGDEEGVDARSVMVCLAINHLNPGLHLVAEVFNEEHLPHFKRAHVDEVFVSSQVSSKLLLRGALYPNVSHAINELLTNSRGSEFYQTPLSSIYWGMTFGEVIMKCLQDGRGIPIGVADDKGTYVNPDRDYKIKQGDILIYISREPSAF